MSNFDRESASQAASIIPNFVAIEGIDGAGKSEFAAALIKKIVNEGYSARRDCEPTEGVIGQIIRKILHHDIEVNTETLALLFAADRHEHCYGSDGIIEYARKGWVICDRYFFSSLAYQGEMLHEKGKEELVYRINDSFPLPAHLIFFDIQSRECPGYHAVQKRAYLYETEQFLDRVYRRYKSIIEHYRRHFPAMQIHYIHTIESPEVMAYKIWAEIQG